MKNHDSLDLKIPITFKDYIALQFWCARLFLIWVIPFLLVFVILVPVASYLFQGYSVAQAFDWVLSDWGSALWLFLCGLFGGGVSHLGFNCEMAKG